MHLPDPKRRNDTIEDWETWDGSWELIHGRASPTHPTPQPHALLHGLATILQVVGF